jgi:SAM-dependent methyltransferase
MKPLDRVLQRWRIDKARPYIPAGARVLDVGCADGALFKRLKSQVGCGVGIDPDVPELVEAGGYRLLPGRFPDDVPAGESFDAITMLATMEHFPQDRLPDVGAACGRLLTPGGVLIVTVPSPVVDRILDVLKSLKLLDGMDLHEHTGFDPARAPAIFAACGLALTHAKRFQFGLNHLFVFRKPSP